MELFDTYFKSKKANEVAYGGSNIEVIKVTPYKNYFMVLQVDTKGEICCIRQIGRNIEFRDSIRQNMVEISKSEYDTICDKVLAILK